MPHDLLYCINTDINDLYQQTIREHARNPEYRYPIERATRTRRMDNAGYGDWVELSLLIEERLIREAAFTGEGCALAIASADICCGSLVGLAEADARFLVHDVLAAPDGEEEAAVRIAETTAAPLLAARYFPGRLGCVRLAWEGTNGGQMRIGFSFCFLTEMYRKPSYHGVY